RRGRDSEGLEQAGELLPDALLRRLVLESGAAAATRARLGWLLRHARRLVLSAPRIEDNDEARPTMALADLMRWRAQGLLQVAEAADASLPSRPRPPLIEERAARARAVIEARASAAL